MVVRNRGPMLVRADTDQQLRAPVTRIGQRGSGGDDQQLRTGQHPRLRGAVVRSGPTARRRRPTAPRVGQQLRATANTPAPPRSHRAGALDIAAAPVNSSARRPTPGASSAPSYGADQGRGGGQHPPRGGQHPRASSAQSCLERLACCARRPSRPVLLDPSAWRVRNKGPAAHSSSSARQSQNMGSGVARRGHRLPRLAPATHTHTHTRAAPGGRA